MAGASASSDSYLLRFYALFQNSGERRKRETSLFVVDFVFGIMLHHGSFRFSVRLFEHEPEMVLLLYGNFCLFLARFKGGDGEGRKAYGVSHHDRLLQPSDFDWRMSALGRVAA